MFLSRIILVLLTVFVLVADNGASACGYEVINRLPHDRNAFTQGLVVSGDELVESTGSWRASTIRRVDIASGQVVKQAIIEDNVFGEGATIIDGMIYSLTWQAETGYIWSEDTLEFIGNFAFEGEGWGLTTNGYWLILSNGTPTISFLDPKTMAVVKTIEVTDDGIPTGRLNELEWVNGRILANIWQSERIAVINADSGRVEEWIDLTGLRAISDTDTSPDSVLNGIAYDPRGDRLYVTGKNWPWLYHIVPGDDCSFKTVANQKSIAR